MTVIRNGIVFTDPNRPRLTFVEFLIETSGIYEHDLFNTVVRPIRLEAYTKSTKEAKASRIHRSMGSWKSLAKERDKILSQWRIEDALINGQSQLVFGGGIPAAIFKGSLDLLMSSGTRLELVVKSIVENPSPMIMAFVVEKLGDF
jgi:hypothetical protein